MKKILLLFMLFGTLTFALEITSIDPLDFGVVVTGEDSATIKNSGVYIKGRANRKVEIFVPKKYELNGNVLNIQPVEKIITLDEHGKGIFHLNLELDISNVEEYETLTDNLNIKVKYVEKK